MIKRPKPHVERHIINSVPFGEANNDLFPVGNHPDQRSPWMWEFDINQKRKAKGLQPLDLLSNDLIDQDL